MPNHSAIPTLLKMLSEYTGSPTVNNFYSPPILLNVSEYIHALISRPYSGDLLVGEAPGWAGCALTGIPFTSEQVVRLSPHPFIDGLRPRLTVVGYQAENTATMVWNRLTNSSRLPAFWNAYPFHPHVFGGHQNRQPTATEEQFGATVLATVLEILTPQRVFAVGRTAEQTLQTYFPVLRAQYIRHPSNGGQPAFLSGLAEHHIV